MRFGIFMELFWGNYYGSYQEIGLSFFVKFTNTAQQESRDGILFGNDGHKFTDGHSKKFQKLFLFFSRSIQLGEFWRRLNCFIQRVITMSHHLLWVNDPWVVPPFAIVDFCFTLPKFGSVKPPGAAGWPPPLPFLLFFFKFLKIVGSRIFCQK